MTDLIVAATYALQLAGMALFGLGIWMAADVATRDDQ